MPVLYRWIIVTVHFHNRFIPGDIVEKGLHWFQSREDAVWHGHLCLINYRHNNDICDTWPMTVVIEESAPLDVAA